MEEKLEKYLEQFVQTLKDGGDFMMQELPLFIQEYLTYYTVYHGVISLFCLLGVVAIGYGTYRIIKAFEYDEDIIGFSILMGMIPMVALSFGFFENLFSFLKVWLAPRVYLIENLIELI